MRTEAERFACSRKTSQCRNDGKNASDRGRIRIGHAQRFSSERHAAGGVIQVSEKARKAVLIRRSRKSRWITWPGSLAPFTVIEPSSASTKTLYIWCLPVADIAGATSTAKGAFSPCQ